ncbi:MAG: Zn-dependent exopeptidase M28 [Clostridia bacterium]|nr:Zn-dependent exopeptidase M28 [Clostridia bacterium]
MNQQKMKEIFEQTSYVRMGGSAPELRCANYLVSLCEELGLTASLEPFEVAMAEMQSASLIADGKEIECKGYLLAGTHEVEAPLYYLTNVRDPYALSLCKGKIVLLENYLGYWLYQDILKNGAVGFITFDGHANYADRDIDTRELRPYVSNGNKIPGVNINVKSAVSLIENDVKTVKIKLEQKEGVANSHNVVVDLPGKIDQTILLTAHYDTTSLSLGAYDNMSGCVGLLGIMEHFSKNPHRYGLRFVFCGSEERGLLGAKAYAKAHEEELAKIALNINLDMIGCTMGKMIACCTTEEKLVHYISYLGHELGVPISSYQDVYSSDSTPFADKGVPALSFARQAPSNTATIHNRYDTVKLMKMEKMEEDIAFIIAFTERMANAVHCPVAREIPENMKEALDYYLLRKRKK